MKTKHSRYFKAASLLLVFSGCHNYTADCDFLRNCQEDAAVGGSTSGGAHAVGGATATGGTSAGQGGSSSSGVSSPSVTASYVPCNGECKDSTPVCNIETNVCVECVKSDDCKDPSKKVCGGNNTCITCASHDDCRSDATKPVCDTSVVGGACVECTANNDCKDASKSLCDTSAKACVSCLATSDCKDASSARCDTDKHECAPCKEDGDCSQIDGKGVCDAGLCVQCTVQKEDACEGKSCHPKKKECTSTARGIKDYCEACEADSECIGGEIETPTARCVPMTFGPTAEAHGNYCLQIATVLNCQPPFGVHLATRSASGVDGTYCGINQSATTCKAVRDLIGSKACTEVDSTAECGAGKGGLCKDFSLTSVPNLRCTIPCAVDIQCPSGNTCPSAKPWCQ